MCRCRFILALGRVGGERSRRRAVYIEYVSFTFIFTQAEESAKIQLSKDQTLSQPDFQQKPGMVEKSNRENLTYPCSGERLNTNY